MAITREWSEGTSHPGTTLETSVTLTLTASPAAGRLLVLSGRYENGANNFNAPTDNTGGAWPHVLTWDRTNTVAGVFFYKFAAGAETSVAFTLPAGAE